MTTEESPQQTGRMSAGEQLRRAREAAGLSVAQVAERQHLRPSVIQAIESGDYQQIDSELFLKGYVRAYAGQVGLSPDAVIAQLDEELEPARRERELAEETNPLQDIERRKLRKKRVARLIALLIILGFLAYVGMRVMAPTPEVPQQTGVPEVDTPAVPDTAEAPQLPEAEPEPEGELAEPETAIESEPATEPEPAAELGAETAPVVPVEPQAQGFAAAPEPELAPEPAPEARPAEPTVDAPPVPAPPSAEPGVTLEPEAPAEPAPVVPEGPEVALAASFVSPCWVEITDATGQRLVAALFDRGDELRVEGQPPMRVVLGAADAVSELQFRGEIIDLSTYRTVNNRVEFTLDI
ncbi:MAG: DUF4115 domain-containing protein [Marinobacter sp.]|uniref:RodZ domain-containing protein n=1 Tax=Marinobacter sp. TaxID=50741 RepID=UPI00299E56E4|nr:RodZ domain-containing protein [Marinobacter sp.]MDX1635052.1 DUF4115 domain-containing protein [Marinobacter sp.]